MIWRAFLGSGEAVYCSGVSREAVNNWFQLTDVREERQLTRGRADEPRGARSASYAAAIGNWYSTDVTARQEPEPGWWRRTLADAEADLGGAP